VTEELAVHELERFHREGIIKRVTSRESWREQAKTRDPAKRALLDSARDLVSVVQDDHRLLGFSHIYGPYGTIAANPIISDVVDEPLFRDLTLLGLEEEDARHFMYAATNGCERFVTLDSDFLDRMQVLQARCPSLLVVTPSELVAEQHTRGD
jgi:hypothetical protein